MHKHLGAYFCDTKIPPPPLTRALRPDISTGTRTPANRWPEAGRFLGHGSVHGVRFEGWTSERNPLYGYSWTVVGITTTPGEVHLGNGTEKRFSSIITLHLSSSLPLLELLLPKVNNLSNPEIWVYLWFCMQKKTPLTMSLFWVQTFQKILVQFWMVNVVS